MTQRPVWPAHSIRIDPEAVKKARVAALLADKRLGDWIKDAIEEKIEREKADED